MSSLVWGVKMKGNCQRCAKGLLLVDGRVWCSQDKCEYEFGKPTYIKLDYSGVTIGRKKRRQK